MLTFGPAALSVLPRDDLKFTIPYAEIASMDISGPGSVTRGGGFIGGGFGVEGALEGMAVATVLNALTTKTKIHTFISITTNIGELHLHYSGMEPGALRIALSPVVFALRRLDPVWRQGRLDALRFALAEKQLSDNEFQVLSERLASGKFPGIVNENAEGAELPLPASLVPHLDTARLKRKLGFNRPQISDHLRSIGLQEAEVDQLLQSLYRPHPGAA